MDASNKILEKLKTIHNLPTLPIVVQQVGKLVKDPNSDAKRVAAVIEDDPAIMARILKVVNSALYGGSETISSVQHAVARLGMGTVSNIAMTTSVFSAFGEGEDDIFNREMFWRHSISCGIAACVVYDRARDAVGLRMQKDELRLGGLLHDIGKVVLDEYFHQEFIEAVKRCRDEKITLIEAERLVMGTDHSEVGAWLGEKWQLSEALSGVVRAHHDPDQLEGRNWTMAALCHIANYICNYHKIGDGGDVTAPSFHSGIWKKLGLGVGDISEVVDMVDEESKKSEILMGFVQK